MQTATKTGTEITLTAKLSQLDRPVVRASFRHPKAGQIAFDLAGFGTVQGRTGAFGRFNRQTIVLSIPRADYDAVLTEAKAIITDAIEQIKSGATRIELSWSEGSPLSGWMTTTKFASRLLIDLGIARDVDGWGTLVSDAAVKTLGESFTFAEAAKLAPAPKPEPKTAPRGPGFCPRCHTYCFGDCSAD